MFIESFERILILLISFLIIAILSLWIEKLINLVEIDQKRPSSFLKKDKDYPHLNQFVTRYGAIFLRYIELILIAIVGLLFEWGIRSGIQKTSIKFIFPIIIIFIPLSFLTVTLCVPKKSRQFFSPLWWEWLIITILLIFGGVLIFLMLR